MKLSVFMITYNHEKLVAQAIESALSQRTNFDYEIVVGEDCSTDGTRQVIERIQQAHPDRVRLLPPEPNLGMVPNFTRTYEACQGEYVAFLEGDDYWTCDEKLQKQVDFLDRRPDVQTCCHLVNILEDSTGQVTSVFPNTTMTEWKLEDQLVANHIAASSWVVRNRLFGEFPEWFSTLPYGDITFHALNAQTGKIALLPEVMGVFRRHAGSAWTMAPLKVAIRAGGVARGMRALNQHFNYRYDHILAKQSLIAQYELVHGLRREGDVSGYRIELQRARREVLQAIGRHPLRYLSDLRFLKLAARILAPAPLHRLIYERNESP